MEEFGILQGLSQDLGYDKRINDLRYRDQQNQRALAENEAKQALFADSLDYKNAANSFDHAQIKNFATDQIKKIGSYVNQNPDWETNIDKRMQVNAMRKELRENQNVVRGLASDTAYKNYLADLQEVAKNPQQHDTDAYNDISRQWNNYLQYGNQNGPEAAANEGVKAFLYEKPKDFIDINKAFADIGTKFHDVKAGKLKGGGMGSYEEYADPNSLNAVATQMYSQNKRQFDKLAAEKGLDPIEYIKVGINAYIPKKRDFGDYSMQKLYAEQAFKEKQDRIKVGKEHPSASSYEMEIANKNHSMVTPEQMKTLVDSDSPTFLYDNKGKKKIDLTGSINSKVTGYNFYPDPDGRDVTLKGKKFAEAYAYIPIEKAIELGIVNDATKGLDLWMGGDDSVKDEYKNNVTIETKEDKDGKIHKAVKIKVFQPFDVNNSANAGAFDTKVVTSKQRDLPQKNYQNNTQEPISASKQDFINSGYSEAQIQEGVNRGLIKLK